MARSFALTYLNAEQISELTEHLSDVLSEQEVATAVATLNTAVALARPYSNPRWQHAWVTFENATIRDYSAIEKQAAELRRRLDVLKPHHVGVIIGRPEDKRRFEWDRFFEDLEKVRSGAKEGVQRYKQMRRRGRPSFEWRDKLIAAAFGIYPLGKAKLATGSHFEQTISILLEFLKTDTVNTEVDDLHSVIVDALRRHPTVRRPVSASKRASLPSRYTRPA